MNPEYFAVGGLLEVLQTIVHEMVHMWQAHFGTPGRRGYHNAEWAAKMEVIGLMPSNTGKPGGARTGEKMADYPIPGGRFEAACQELLDTSFTVSWFDRFPPSSAAALMAANGIELPGAIIMAPAADGSPEGKPKRPTRVKYRCAGCQAQVWGKPELKIGCGDCGRPFAPV